MKIALYARVSKANEQNPENQLLELRRWAKAAEHTIIGEFVDEVSSRDTRPQKEIVLKKIRLGEIDGVAFVALDRWGRTMSELIFELEEFSKSGKALISLKEGMDLSNAAGRMMANMLAAMANFERDRISERTKMGVERANKQGKIRGRHPKDCGCGMKLADGTVHNGAVKPIRDEHNMVIGWEGLNQKSKRKAAIEREKQTPPQNTTPITEKDPIQNQTPV